MPITTTWLNDEKKIVLVNCIVPWTWAEYDKSVDETFAMMKSVDYVVHSIVTVPPADVAPQGMPLPSIMRMIRLRPKNCGLTFIVGAQRRNGFLRKISEVIRNVKKSETQNTHYVNSMEEALAGIATFDAHAQPAA